MHYLNVIKKVYVSLLKSPLVRIIVNSTFPVVFFHLISTAFPSFEIFILKEVFLLLLTLPVFICYVTLVAPPSVIIYCITAVIDWIPFELTRIEFFIMRILKNLKRQIVTNIFKKSINSIKHKLNRQSNFKYAHEGTKEIIIPLIILTILSIFIGNLFYEISVGFGTNYWGFAIFILPQNYNATDIDLYQFYIN